MRIEKGKGIWDTAETRLVDAILSFGCKSGNAPALMVDVGMHIGYFSGMALAAGCRVIAFEPTAYHHPYAMITAMLSGHFHRFTLHKLAASDKSGSKIPYDNWSFSTSTTTAKNGTILSYVSTTRIDDLVDEDVLYLKVDVESHEPEVFQGLTKLLTTRVVLVIVWEYTVYRANNSIPLPSSYLKELGYFLCDIHHGGAGNYLALHPQLHPTLRETIMAMKDINIKDVFSYSGLNTWDYL